VQPRRTPRESADSFCDVGESHLPDPRASESTGFLKAAEGYSPHTDNEVGRFTKLNKPLTLWSVVILAGYTLTDSILGPHTHLNNVSGYTPSPFAPSVLRL
jgi:hypothetical protein